MCTPPIAESMARALPDRPAARNRKARPSGRATIRPATASFPNSRRVNIACLRHGLNAMPYETLLIQRERVQRISRGDEDVLPSVDQIGFRRVRDLPDLGMPQRLAVGRIEGNEVARDVAAKQQLAGGGQQAGSAARVTGRPKLVLPDGLAG